MITERNRRIGAAAAAAVTVRSRFARGTLPIGLRPGFPISGKSPLISVLLGR